MECILVPPARARRPYPRRHVAGRSPSGRPSRSSHCRPLRRAPPTCRSPNYLHACMPPGAEIQGESGRFREIHACMPPGAETCTQAHSGATRCTRRHASVRPATSREILATGDTGRYREMQGDTRTGATSSQSGDTCKRRPPCRRFARPPLRRQSPACSPGCRGSSDVISRHQSPSVAIRRHQTRSVAIRCNQVHSGANQRTFDLPLSACMVAQTSAARARS